MVSSTGPIYPIQANSGQEPKALRSIYAVSDADAVAQILGESGQEPWAHKYSAIIARLTPLNVIRIEPLGFR